MAGSIRRRGKDGWGLTIDLGRDAQGRRLRRFLTVRGTKKEAERVLSEALHQRDTGIDIAPNKITVGDFLERWLRDYATEQVAASTLQRYQGIVRHHLAPALGRVRLRDLRPAHIQAAYSSFQRRDGRGESLSAKTVKEHHAILREALSWAVKWQLLAANPADAVSAPRAQRREMRVLSPEGAQRFLEAASDTPHYTFFYLALQTGARSGELLALRWSDVDLDGGTLRIVRTARFARGQGIVFSQPKTQRSRRPVALSPDTVAALREHRREQLEQRMQVGPGYEENGLVFADALGRPVYDSTVRRVFYGVVKAADVGPLRVHDLRHTAATLMLQAGVHPKIVSERLGHATVSITLDTYSHVLPDMQREAASALDGVLAATGS